jgi:hypothetical protein
MCGQQGGQIGRIFAIWLIVYFRQFFENCKKFLTFLGNVLSPRVRLCIDSSKRDWATFWAIFYEPIRGSMLWSQFSAKLMAFFLNTNSMINFFQNLALFWVKNADFVAKCFGENFKKIITSVPGHPDGTYAFGTDLLECFRAAAAGRVGHLDVHRAGADFMKPFRPEFTDKTLSTYLANFKLVCNCDLQTHNISENIYLLILNGNLSKLRRRIFIRNVFRPEIEFCKIDPWWSSTSSLGRSGRTAAAGRRCRSGKRKWVQDYM